MDRETPIYIFCIFDELFSLIREFGFKSVHQLKIDAPEIIGPIEVTPRRAMDADVDSMFQVRAEGLNILNVVDSLIDDVTIRELEQKDPWDLVLWPFQTMLETDVLSPSRASPASLELPHEWIEQIKILNPKYIVPSSCQFIQESWSWYNHRMFPITYEQFQKEITAVLPNTQVVRMNPSVAIELSEQELKFAEPLTWVSPVSSQDVDYKYDRDLTPPTTAEISKHFAALTEEQTKRVFKYCRTELLQKYESLEPPQDEYFKKPRRWRLSIYDHRGRVTHFDYLLKAAHIENIESTHEPLSWLTEVPIAKLYAALECGEALTSMYMRINDQTFSAEIEQEIGSTDVVEDPLVRCLFSGVFGAYQRAQLKRLQK